MATYLLRFGTLTGAARKAVIVKRTDDAIALIKKRAGEFKAGYALFGEVDFLVNKP